MLEEISKPLFELNQNQQSKIIETSIAKHIIILQSIEPERQLKFDEVKENIKNTITAIELNNYFTKRTLADGGVGLRLKTDIFEKDLYLRIDLPFFIHDNSGSRFDNKNWIISFQRSI